MSRILFQQLSFLNSCVKPKFAYLLHFVIVLSRFQVDTQWRKRESGTNAQKKFHVQTAFYHKNRNFILRGKILFLAFPRTGALQRSLSSLMQICFISSDLFRGNKALAASSPQDNDGKTPPAKKKTGNPGRNKSGERAAISFSRTMRYQ